MDSPPPQNRLYDDLAYLWPVISPPEDYAAEAVYWRRALREKLGPGRHHVLELGVGGGHNLSHLTPYFQATAVDLSPRMLALSEKLNPGVEHHLGDMRTVRLGRKFDAVLVHDAISYMLNEDDLRATFATARYHLRPGRRTVGGPGFGEGHVPARSPELAIKAPVLSRRPGNQRGGASQRSRPFGHDCRITLYLHHLRERRGKGGAGPPPERAVPDSNLGGN